VGAFRLLLMGLRCAQLDRFALKMDPELDPEQTFVSSSDMSHPGIEFSNPTGSLQPRTPDPVGEAEAARPGGEEHQADGAARRSQAP
jgi:hypothetical protein